MGDSSNLSNQELALVLAGRLVVDNTAARYYYNDVGQLHRDDGPAVILADGSLRWFVFNELHREDGPTYSNGQTKTEMWFQHGKLHRIDGPAVIWENGRQEFWEHGKQL